VSACKESVCSACMLCVTTSLQIIQHNDNARNCIKYGCSMHLQQAGPQGPTRSCSRVLCATTSLQIVQHDAKAGLCFQHACSMHFQHSRHRFRDAGAHLLASQQDAS
jgi:hypothetical protein